jgi:hypothetical protein
MRIKHPERIELLRQYKQVETELILSWKTYNQARKFVEKYNTDENYLQMAEANKNWTIKTEEYDSIKIKVNEFKNPIYYEKFN